MERLKLWSLQKLMNPGAGQEVAPEMELILETHGQYIKKCKINLHTKLYISPFYKKNVS